MTLRAGQEKALSNKENILEFTVRGSSPKWKISS